MWTKWQLLITEWIESRFQGGPGSYAVDSKTVWMINMLPRSLHSHQYPEPAEADVGQDGTVYGFLAGVEQKQGRNIFLFSSSLLNSPINHKKSLWSSTWFLFSFAFPDPSLVSGFRPENKSLGHPTQSVSPRERTRLQGWQEPDFKWFSRSRGKRNLFLLFLQPRN